MQVFANKRIFSDPALRHAQVTFAALHFAMTAGLLYLISTPAIGLFERKRLNLRQILPLAIAVICSVVLTNASLAYSSIQFYQIMRVAVTPCVAFVNWVILKKTIPLSAAVMLVPVCVGVAIVSYFDTAAASQQATRGTSPLGVFFALISLVATATYTVLIKKFHETTECKSNQLLLNQSPVSVLIMLYIIPFSDDVAVWHTVSGEVWLYIFVVGDPSPFASSQILTGRKFQERTPGLLAPHLPVHHHQRCGTSQQHRGRPLQNLPDHRHRLGAESEIAHGWEHRGHRACAGGDYRVSRLSLHTRTAHGDRSLTDWAGIRSLCRGRRMETRDLRAMACGFSLQAISF